MSQSQHQRRSSILADGQRPKIRIGDVKGLFTRWRTRLFWALIAVYAALPLIQVGGKPLLFLDILQRRFYILGQTFNAQDAYLLWPFLAGGLLALFAVTALLGRVWCGYACPQTVFLEGVFRRIERWIEGPKHAQLALARAPWGGGKALRLAAKHALYLLAALAVSHIFLSYFVSFDQLRQWVRGDPREHWVAFVWMAAITGATYLNFAWFREQTCVILCPYGRLQSALNDDDTVTVSYDARRGEPRGKVGTPGANDCVNCLRCVDVCPTGIDIREGLQMECIACANCIDACDDIMRRLGRAPGLIRYESLRGLQGQGQRWLRPRILLYIGLLALFTAIGAWLLGGRKPFEATLIRQQGLPYVRAEGRLRNQYLLHVVNKTPQASRFRIELVLPQEASAIIPVQELDLPSLGGQRLPVNVLLPLELWRGPFEVLARTTDLGSGRVVESKLRFLGP
jgi:cytochrome c oxidase accessory protein FixG